MWMVAIAAETASTNTAKKTNKANKAQLLEWRRCFYVAILFFVEPLVFCFLNKLICCSNTHFFIYY